MLSEFKRLLQEKGEIDLRVKIRAGAGRTAARDIMGDGALKINIGAEPVKGKANRELINFLAKEFDVLKNNVKIVKGHSDKIKVVKITKSL